MHADHETGAQLAAVLAEHLGLIEQWTSRARDLAAPLPLGANPIGTAMSDKFSRRADGGEASFAAVLEEYGASLDQARFAVDESFRGYRDLEARHSTVFDRAGGACR